MCLQHTAADPCTQPSMCQAAGRQAGACGFRAGARRPGARVCQIREVQVLHSSPNPPGRRPPRCGCARAMPQHRRGCNGRHGGGRRAGGGQPVALGPSAPHSGETSGPAGTGRWQERERMQQPQGSTARACSTSMQHGQPQGQHVRTPRQTAGWGQALASYGRCRCSAREREKVGKKHHGPEGKNARGGVVANLCSSSGRQGGQPRAAGQHAAALTACRRRAASRGSGPHCMPARAGPGRSEQLKQTLITQQGQAGISSQGSR